MIKIIILVANIFFAQYILAQSALAKEKITWIDFKWNDTTTKSAIFLRSRVDTFDYNFNWQLDTGSPYTFIYGTTWNIFKQRFPILSTLAKQTDSISKGNYRKV